MHSYYLGGAIRWCLLVFLCSHLLRGNLASLQPIRHFRVLSAEFSSSVVILHLHGAVISSTQSSLSNCTRMRVGRVSTCRDMDATRCL